MIKFEHSVFANAAQMEFIIQGMRNPMNSWDKSDSGWFLVTDPKDLENGYIEEEKIISSESDDGRGAFMYLLGKNDLDLMTRLRDAGTDHRKFMRMMPVYVRITAPLYWWKEFDTYKVGTVTNSCSTMHKIQEDFFTMDDFSTDHLLPASIENLEETIQILNEVRDLYLGYGGFREKFKNTNMNVPDKKDVWWQLIQLLPTSYNQTRNVMMNYEVLANIYDSRKNHKLDEWKKFCEWVEFIPYSELITESRLERWN